MKQILMALFLFFCSVSICFPRDVTLIWDPNTESDLAGYKLYYRTEFVTYEEPTPAEDEVPMGPSPIVLYINCTGANCVDNNNPEFTLEMDISDKDYWMVLTAFDNEVPENESGYSNEVTTKDIGDDGTVNVGGGGGSGGCFINTLKWR